MAKTQPAEDLATPVMSEEPPAPGKRVRQVAPEYKGTKVYHTLYLPNDWEKGKTYPVLVEYTGNKAPFCGSTGEVKGANLGYGISGGKGFIWVSMPYVQKGKRENAVTWWGDRQATIDYCKVNLPAFARNMGETLTTFLSADFPGERLPVATSAWRTMKSPPFEGNDRPRSFRRTQEMGIPRK